jgi:hypothetical protein
MPAVFIQSVFNRPVGSDPTTTVSITVTAGNLLAVAAGGLEPQTIMFSDNGGNTYVPVDTITAGAGPARMSTAYALIVASGTIIITATHSAATPFRFLIAHEISGLDPASPLDVHAIAQGLSSGSAITTQAGDYIFGVAYSDSGGVFTAGSGFTLRVQDAGPVGIGSEDEIQSAAGSIAAVFGGGSPTNITAMMAFKAASGAVILTGQSMVYTVG